MRFSLSDMLVGVLVTVLIGTATAATAVRQRELDNRVKCASNLHQIGLAIVLYEGDNTGRFPRTEYATGNAPTPTWGTPYSDDGARPAVGGPVNPLDVKGTVRPRVNDVSAALFLLLREEQIASRVFVCPSTTASGFDFGGGQHSAQDWANWPGKAGLAAHLSYGLANPYPTQAAILAGLDFKVLDATYAEAGDIGSGGKAALDLKPGDPKDKQRAANSPNHGRDGQNLLYGDGHVEFYETAFAGTNHDNVYTAGGPEIKEADRGTATVAGAPVASTDSVLLPTADDVGPPPPQ